MNCPTDKLSIPPADRGRLSKHTLLFIFFTLLIDAISFGIIIPVKPQLIMAITGTDLSTAAHWAGLLLFCYALAQFIMIPVLANLSDRYGRRSIILFSLAACSIDFFIMGIAQNIWLLLAARIFSGVFTATIATANACIADISSPEKRAVNFGAIGSALGIGLMIGPTIGGAIGEQWGPRAPLFVASALAGANLLYGYFVLPETLPGHLRRRFHLSRANPLGALWQLRRDPLITRLLLAGFLLQLAYYTFPAIWSYFSIAKFSWSLSQIGWSLFMVGLTNLAVQGGLIRTLVPRLGEQRAAVLGLSVMAPAFLAYAFASQGWMIYPIILFGALGGIILPSLQGIMSSTLPQNRQGELMGAIACTTSLAMIAGPPAMIHIFAVYTADSAPVYLPGAPFLVAAVLVAGAAILILTTFKKMRPPAALANQA